MSDQRETEPSRTPRGLSRRGFLKGMGGTVLTTAALGPAAATAAAQDAGSAASKSLSGPSEIELTINGAARKVTVEPRTTLLATLRDKLQLTGSKEVCDRGTCGACTVLVDGRSQLACMTLAVDVRGREITTVEGLSDGDTLSPLQEEFVAKDALMCGFCTCGFVMSAEALLRANPNPSPAEIREGVAGNLCRCGTYPRVFEAIESAAKRKGR